MSFLSTLCDMDTHFVLIICYCSILSYKTAITSFLSLEKVVHFVKTINKVNRELLQTMSIKSFRDIVHES